MFTEELWAEFVEQESANYEGENGKRKYLKKGYLHFDHRFWFPERLDEIRTAVENSLKVLKPKTGRLENWSFEPFIRHLVKTPRYRWQVEEGKYNLETKTRPICFASHRDSLIFGFYSFAITKTYEKYIRQLQFDDCVLAYRSDLGKCNIHFAKDVFDYIKGKGPCTAIALDIKGYFDHIDHQILLEKWREVWGDKLPEDQYLLYRALSKYSYVNLASIYRKYNVDMVKLQKQAKRSRKAGKKVELPQTLLSFIPARDGYKQYDRLRKDRLIVTNDRLNANTGRMAGIPQGSAISSLLSNIYLIDFDKHFSQRSKTEDFLYRRYCDDIIIICPTEMACALTNDAIALIRKDFHLEIQPKKVETIDFLLNSKGKFRSFRRTKKTVPVNPTPANEERLYKNFQYLGFEFNGKDIFIRPSSLSRYFRRMKARIEKSVKMAYSPNGKLDKVFRRKVFERYSHLGKNNFLTYAFRAAEYMDSQAIRKQLRNHYYHLQHTLEKKNEQWYSWKASKGKVVEIKKVGKEVTSHTEE